MEKIIVCEESNVSVDMTSAFPFPLPDWPSDCTPGERYDEEVNYDILKYFNTDIPDPYPTWEIALKCISYAFAMSVGIIGNCAVILVMLCFKHMRTTTNVYIVNLAVSDLLLCCSCMWIHLGQNITSVWPFGDFFCSFNAFFESLNSHFLLLITLTIVATGICTCNG